MGKGEMEMGEMAARFNNGKWKCKMEKRAIKGRDREEKRTAEEALGPQDDVAGALCGDIETGQGYLFHRPAMRYARLVVFATSRTAVGRRGLLTS